jgi:hypothetical protein
VHDVNPHCGDVELEKDGANAIKASQMRQTYDAFVAAGGSNARSWAFKSRVNASGTNYIGGFYIFGASANDFNPSIPLGTANLSYAAHVLLVQAAGGGGGTDTTIRVTGTSITDLGVVLTCSATTVGANTGTMPTVTST